METSKIAKKISRWNEKTRKAKNFIDQRAFIEPTSVATRKRLKKRQKVSGTEILNIAHRVLVEKHFMKDVAKEFRITIPRVSVIVGKVSKNTKVLQEMKQQNAEEKNRDAIIRQQILTMMGQRRYIDSSEMVQKHVNEHTSLEVKQHTV